MTGRILVSTGLQRVFVGFLFLIFFCASAFAQNRITVEEGKATFLPDAANIETVFIADNEIADANVSEGNDVFVFGKSVGETTLIVTTLDGSQEITYNVVVTHSLSEIRRTLSQRFPGSAISVNSSRGSILLTGFVESEIIRQRVVQTVENSVPTAAILDQITVTSSNLIRLRVRLLEVNRTRVEQFGIDWEGTIASNGFFLGVDNGGVITIGKDDAAVDRMSATLDVLASNGIVSIIQETVLSTVNGQDAQFSVGGEIPIPTFVSDRDGATQGSYGLDYKFIGTQLIFTPSTAPGNKLRLSIDSVISTADTSSATVNGNVFPNLSTRSFRTNVELRDRQSFAIAGISRNETVSALRNANNRVLSKLIDTFGGLDRITERQQELVVIVTPILSDLEAVDITERVPHLPTNLEYILRSGPSGKKPGSLTNVPGNAGFQY